MADPKASVAAAQDTKKSEHYVQVRLPAAEQEIKLAGVTRPKPTARRKVAVLVAHGMGSQVPFETLQMVADRLLDYRYDRTTANMPVKVGLVELGAKQLPRAEITIRDHEDHPVDVHFYEAYWAPLTEGKVTARDSLWFLFMAGWRGLWGSLTARKFERWMFGDWQKFAFSRLRLFAYFLAAILVLASLVLMYASLATLTAGGDFTKPALRLVASDLMFFEKRLALYLVLGLALPMSIRWLVMGAGHRFHLPAGLRWFLRLAFLLTILLTIWTGAKVGYHVVNSDGNSMFAVFSKAADVIIGGFTLSQGGGGFSINWRQFAINIIIWLFGPMTDPANPPAVTSQGVMIALAVGLAIAFVMKWFLREYVGDVAAYVSSYSVSKFAELRAAIQKAALDVMQPVYAFQSVPSGPFDYQEIVVVGHSLGSVIAYDAIDALINLPPGNQPLEVARRTKAILTFGSPLDKTAFIFRLQRPKQNEVREALAAAMQPMILDYGFRPRNWLNIFSPDDWISGSLEFYDPDSALDPGTRKIKHQHMPDPIKHVQNVPDPEACIPLAAHTFYWTSETFKNALYNLVVS